MLSLLLLICFCVGYFYLHKFRPRSQKEMIYVSVFVGIYIVILYLANFQQELLHKLFKQIYDIQNKPLYDLSDFSKPDNSVKEFQLQMLQNQGSRCSLCQNFILPKDIDYTSIQYKLPLHQGGSHSHDNLHVVCPNCHAFQSY